LVWDNGSTDGTGRWLARQRGIAPFRSRVNLGISAGWNQLFRRAGSPIVVRLDDDTRVPSGWMEKLLEPLEDPSVAAVGCKFVTPEGRLRATEFIPPVFPRPLGEDGPQWRYTRTVEAVGGPCCAFRADALRRVGGYSQALSDQAEDVDLCLRLRCRGYRVAYVGSLAVVNQALNRRRWPFVDRNRRVFRSRWLGFSGFPRPDSHEIDRRYLRAWRLYQRGSYADVLKELQPIADSPLRECGAQFVMALAHRARGDIPRARALIRGLVREHSVNGLLAEGAWAMDQGCRSQARRAVERGIRHFPGEPAFRFLRAQLLRSGRGGSRGLRSDYRTALRHLPASRDPFPMERILGIPGLSL